MIKKAQPSWHDVQGDIERASCNRGVVCAWGEFCFQRKGLTSGGLSLSQGSRSGRHKCGDKYFWGARGILISTEKCEDKVVAAQNERCVGP